MATYSAAIASGAALIIIVTGIFLLSRSILVPLGLLRAEAARLGTGDFSKPISLNRNDEIGQLAYEFNSMAAKLERSQGDLIEMATHDVLAGLCNRREFYRRIKEEIGRATRYDHPFSLMMIDIDGFKRINDLFGHQADDKILRSIADMIAKQVRPIDQAARYGGDEFTVILPETAPTNALITAKRICETIAAAEIQVTDRQTVNLNVSVGLAGFPNNVRSEDELISAADKALYDAKKAGWGSIRMFEEAA